MRYVIHTYLVYEDRVVRESMQEFVIYRDAAEAMSNMTLSFTEGEYELMIWADLEIPGADNEYFYDATDFVGIKLVDYKGSTNYKDCFRGSRRISVNPDAGVPEAIIVDMSRPTAKFEIIST